MFRRTCCRLIKIQIQRSFYCHNYVVHFCLSADTKCHSFFMDDSYSQYTIKVIKNQYFFFLFSFSVFRVFDTKQYILIKFQCYFLLFLHIKRHCFFHIQSFLAQTKRRCTVYFIPTIYCKDTFKQFDFKFERTITVIYCNGKGNTLA